MVGELRSDLRVMRGPSPSWVRCSNPCSRSIVRGVSSEPSFSLCLILSIYQYKRRTCSRMPFDKMFPKSRMRFQRAGYRNSFSSPCLSLWQLQRQFELFWPRDRWRLCTVKFTRTTDASLHFFSHNSKATWKKKKFQRFPIDRVASGDRRKPKRFRGTRLFIFWHQDSHLEYKKKLSELKWQSFG